MNSPGTLGQIRFFTRGTPVCPTLTSVLKRVSYRVRDTIKGGLAINTINSSIVSNPTLYPMPTPEYSVWAEIYTYLVWCNRLPFGRGGARYPALPYPRPYPYPNQPCRFVFRRILSYRKLQKWDADRRVSRSLTCVIPPVSILPM